ncbi:MAG: GNAT family N-acetyltransferase, partial [Elusimicrobiales bacterium]|nr:GNAT family N-acetyltransferase [Elusimicrobiales bacterium]
MKFKFKSIKKINFKYFKEIKNLYKNAGWLESDDNFIRIKNIIKNSYIFVVCFKGKKIVAMGRVISDGINDAYIQDFTVAPKYRRKNIGSKLLSFIVELLIKRGIKWIGLICEKGTENFYTKN